MENQGTADVIREAGRHASDTAQRPRQHAYDAAYDTIDAIGARPERSIETLVAPVGGPEYAGRA